MNKQILLVVILVVVVGTGVTLALTRSQWAATTKIGSVNFPLRLTPNLMSTQVGWRDTGIRIPQGTRMSAEVSGQICFHEADCSGTTVGSYGSDQYCYDPECTSQPYDNGFHHGAALGYLGTSAPISGAEGMFILGEGSHDGWTSTAGPARLWVAINDGDTGDNTGNFTVDVTKASR